MLETIKNYLNEKYMEGFSQNSIANYELDLTYFYQFLTETYSYKNWQEVTLDSILHFLAILHDEHLKSTSISRKLSAIRSFYQYLKRENLITTNISDKIAMPTIRKKLPYVLSEKDINQIIESPDISTPLGLRNRALLELMYATGIRVSELCDLKMENIRLDGRIIHLVGKGNKERILLLGEEACYYLELYYIKARPKLDKKSENSYVFVNRNGQKLTRQGVWKIIKKLVADSGIDQPVSPHTMRHSIATHLLSRGMDLKYIQEILGHEHLVTTQIYTKVDLTKRVDDYYMAHPHGLKNRRNEEKKNG